MFEEKKMVSIGHRGCRGLMPENTIASFIRAIELNADALELDVVITGDKKVLISHEPWINSKICLDKNGNTIAPEIGEKINLYHLSYEEIKKFDCGLKIHPDFPEQHKLKAVKPLLDEMLLAVKEHCRMKNMSLPVFIVEIKSDEKEYDIRQPDPHEFVARVMETLSLHLTSSHYLIQSFDRNILKVVHEKYSEVMMSALNESVSNTSDFFKILEFLTPYYSPQFEFVNNETMRFCRERGIEVFAWTVNNKSDAAKLTSLGVKGIITDYPDRIPSAMSKII